MKVDIDRIITSIDKVASVLDSYFYGELDLDDKSIIMLLYELRISSSQLRVLYGFGDNIES